MYNSFAGADKIGSDSDLIDDKENKHSCVEGVNMSFSKCVNIRTTSDSEGGKIQINHGIIYEVGPNSDECEDGEESNDTCDSFYSGRKSINFYR